MRLPTIVALFLAALTTASGLGLQATAGAPGQAKDVDEFTVTRHVSSFLHLDAARLASDAESLQRIELDLSSALPVPPLVVRLEVHDLREPGHHGVLVGADGTETRVETGFLGTYIGAIEGHPEAIARATITSGYVNVFVDDAALGTFSVESVAPASSRADGLRLHEVSYAPPLAAVPFGPAPADGEEKTDSGTADPLVGSVSDYTTLPNEEHGLNAVVGWERPTTTKSFSIRLDSDGEFYNADPANLWSRQIAIVNNAEGMYNSQVNVAWSVAAQYSFTSNGGPTASTDGCTLRNDFRDYWQANRPTGTFPRAFVAIMSQRNFAGSTIGCAYNGGLSNAGTSGYALIQTKDYDSSEEREIMQHEIGHVFNGRHDYAKKWWSWGCFCYKKTIMIAEGLGAQQKFSEGDDYAANAYRVRKCAESPSTCASMPLPAPNNQNLKNVNLF
jgi:hypothetical protein